MPQHFVFRAYGLHLLWFAPVVAALALSPALVAFVGAAAYAALLLDPAFVGRGNRVEESAALLAGGALLALAVRAAW